MNEKEVESKYRLLFRICVLCSFILIGYTVYQQHFNKSQLVTYESQYQAETAQGIKKAAYNAKIEMLQSQLYEAKNQIAVMKDKKPVTASRITVKEISTSMEKERKKSKADFTIMTNPKEPKEEVDLSNYKENEAVILNQYNVHAYKKVLRQIDYCPKSIDNLSPKEIGFAISRKISKDGKYIGVVVEHDFTEKKRVQNLDLHFNLIVCNIAVF